MPEGKPQQNSKQSDTAWMYGAAALCAVLVIVPTIIGAGLWYGLRAKVARRDWVIIGTTSTVLLVLSWPSVVPAYFSWLAGIVPPDMAFWPVPWWSLLVFAFFVAAALGVLDGTRAMATVSDKLHISQGDGDSVVPTGARRDRVRSKVINTDSSVFAVDAADHSAESHEVGSRSFVLGLDSNGKPVKISESEIRTHAVLLGATGSGKALALDTPVPTPNGWTTMGDLAVGDEVFDAQGRATRVVFTTETQYNRRCFEVVFSDGSTIIADADHRWLTETRASRVSAARAARNEPTRLHRPGDHRDQRHLRALPSVVTTDDIRNTLRTGTAGWANHSIPAAGPLEYAARPHADLPLDPYALGALLGDGGLTKNVKFTAVDEFVIDELRASLPPGTKMTRYDDLTWDVVGTAWHNNPVLTALRDLGLAAANSKTKFIPRCYLESSAETRLGLLQGLMDTDGTVSTSGSCSYSTPSVQLAEDIYELVCSLGIVARRSTKTTSCAPAHVVSFTTTSPVFRLPRKLDRLPSKVRATTDRRYIVDVREHPSVPVRCIQVDNPDHLYLVGRSCITTHNTESIKNLAGNLGDLGWSVIMLDLKEDTAEGGLREFCAKYATHHALQYQEIALSNPHNRYWFNPLLGMTQDEAINTILSLQTFDDGYWQAINKTMVGQVCTLFFDAHDVDPSRFDPPDMYTIGRLLRQKNLTQATKEMRAIVLSSKPERSEDDFSSLAKPSDAEAQSATGLGSRIVNMFESEAGRVVLRPGNDRQVMDVCAGGFVYVGLNTLGLSELARVVSTSAILRLGAYAGARTTGAVKGAIQPTAVIIDEANWIDRKGVQNLLSRARSAGIAVILCTPGPTDWIDEHGDDWNTITQNTNVSIIMRQGNEATAEMCAELIGKKIKTSLISQVRDGDVLDSGSQSERLDYVVGTTDIRGLRVGEAILKVGVPNERVEYCAVRQRNPTDHARR